MVSIPISLCEGVAAQQTREGLDRDLGTWGKFNIHPKGCLWQTFNIQHSVKSYSSSHSSACMPNGMAAGGTRDRVWMTGLYHHNKITGIFSFIILKCLNLSQ